jgi:hypothetical protein
MPDLFEDRALARRCFIGGFFLTVFFGILLNFATYLATRGAYGGDMFEVIGFPIVFRSLGGFAGRYNFSVAALTADLLIILVAATVVGFVFSRWCCRRCSHEKAQKTG